MLSDTSIVMYSHSEYSDVWKMFIGQIDENFEGINKYIFADKKLDFVPDHWVTITYDDNLPYDKRVATCLRQIKEQYCIFHHEDMPLYQPPNHDSLLECKNTLDSSRLSYVKLIKGGFYDESYRDFPYKGCQNLHHIQHNSSFCYAVQPTLWKVKDLQMLYDTTSVSHIREFEPMASRVCWALNIQGAYWYAGEQKRGEHHWDSDVYPYIATAIVKGKWNLSQYKKELKTLSDKYKIDLSIRGVV